MVALDRNTKIVEQSETSFAQFHSQAHLWGRITIWGVIICTIVMPMFLSFGLGFHPGWSVILSGFLNYAAIVAIIWFIEPISYYPILGVSGTYLAFLTGNIGNMCLPSASIAQSIVGAEPGTRKGEVTATLAISAASIVNTTFLIVVILGGSYFINALPEGIRASFSFVLPAIFGGVLAQFALKKPVWGVAAIALGLFATLGPIPQAFQTFICIFGTVAFAVILEKMKK
ncbi:MAG: small-conductance mechanosensitive channel [Solibacillus sp.]